MTRQERWEHLTFSPEKNGLVGGKGGCGRLGGANVIIVNEEDTWARAGSVRAGEKQ